MIESIVKGGLVEWFSVTDDAVLRCVGLSVTIRFVVVKCSVVFVNGSLPAVFRVIGRECLLVAGSRAVGCFWLALSIWCTSMGFGSVEAI